MKFNDILNPSDLDEIKKLRSEGLSLECAKKSIAIKKLNNEVCEAQSIEDIKKILVKIIRNL